MTKFHINFLYFVYMTFDLQSVSVTLSTCMYYVQVCTVKNCSCFIIKMATLQQRENLFSCAFLPPGLTAKDWRQNLYALFTQKKRTWMRKAWVRSLSMGLCKGPKETSMCSMGFFKSNDLSHFHLFTYLGHWTVCKVLEDERQNWKTTPEFDF